MKAAQFIPKKFDPLRAIEWVIAIFTLAGGVFVYTPLYQVSVAQNGLGTVASLLTHPSLIYVFAAFLIIGSLLVMVGIWRKKPQARSAGWFILFLTRFFQALGTVMTTGFLPIIWFYPITISFVMVVLWIVARREVRNGN